MNVRAVPTKEIKSILSEHWVDTTRKPYVLNDTAFIPVQDGYPFTHILPDRKRKKRGYQRIGDIIAFHGPKPGPDLIDEVIITYNPRGIIWYKGHTGKMRIPDIEPLYGETGEVTFKEAGIIYRLDPSRIMFSQGNREEKIRVSHMVSKGEQVCDMFAGIGYFTLPLAKAGAEVHAIELNPESVRYLRTNCIENNLESHIRISEGDCRENMKGIYDRIHMGHYNATDFLSLALKHVVSGTVLHVHGIGNITGEIKQILSDSDRQGSCTHRIIKKIGPKKTHTVTDVVIS